MYKCISVSVFALCPLVSHVNTGESYLENCLERLLTCVAVKEANGDEAVEKHSVALTNWIIIICYKCNLLRVISEMFSCLQKNS